MARKGASEEQIIQALQQVEAGAKVAEVCRQAGVSQATFYIWRKQYGGLTLNELRELCQLREENGRSKRLAAPSRLPQASATMFKSLRAGSSETVARTCGV